MKRLFETKRLPLYAGIAVAFTVLLTWHEAGSFKVSFLTALTNNIWRSAYIVVVNYFFFESAVSFILKKQRYIVFNLLAAVAGIFIFMTLWSFGLYAWRSFGISLGIYTPAGSQLNSGELVQSQMGYSTGSVLFFGIIRHIYNYVKLTQTEQQLRIEKQAAELNYLRSQTNPHFLFNTLNNIYALTKAKSDLAPESVMRLSKLLRFMLYETGGDYIPIDQEIKIIADYIELEKLRYDKSLHINFSYDIEDLKQAVPPLLLMPLIENAFKHGVSETRDNPFVKVHLSVKERQLVLVVMNSSESLPEAGIRENIGLSNLRRQLQLLYSDYNLSVQYSDYVFTANLKINLSTHVKN